MDFNNLAPENRYIVHLLKELDGLADKLNLVIQEYNKLKKENDNIVEESGNRGETINSLNNTIKELETVISNQLEQITQIADDWSEKLEQLQTDYNYMCGRCHYYEDAISEYETILTYDEYLNEQERKRSHMPTFNARIKDDGSVEFVGNNDEAEKMLNYELERAEYDCNTDNNIIELTDEIGHDETK